MTAWIKANPGQAIAYAVLAPLALLFLYVVARGWLLPCVLHIGVCVP